VLLTLSTLTHSTFGSQYFRLIVLLTHRTRGTFELLRVLRVLLLTYKATGQPGFSFLCLGLSCSKLSNSCGDVY